jgi:hypothetical protein
MLDRLAGKILDPSIKWYVDRAFGGYRRYGTISSSTPQTLHICDDMICIPVRFSEYTSWWDKTTNTLTRMFNLQEAWDHTNESNPTTSAPYDGVIGGGIGYMGYFFGIDLTDGTNKVRVYVSVRYYPEPQVLVFNTGKPTNISITVNDPPSALGLSKVSTTGTRGTGNTVISGGQYVVFAKSTIPQVDTTYGVFVTSPIGSSKSYTYEVYYRYLSGIGDLGFNLYTGIKSPQDIHLGVDSLPGKFFGGSRIRTPLNFSGYNAISGVIAVYDSDPYCSAGTFSEYYVNTSVYTGWGEDEGGNVKFIVLTTNNRKHSTKAEQRINFETFAIYDANIGDWFVTKLMSPFVDAYCYGKAGQVIHPITLDSLMMDFDANPSMAIDSSNNVVTWTSPAPSTWTYYDGHWALCNVLTGANIAISSAAVGIYTDDTTKTLPSDARNAFCVAGRTGEIKRRGLMILPFSDTSLYANKKYLVIVRTRIFPTNITTDQFKSWATKLLPKVLSSSDVSGFLNFLPLVVGKFGKPISDITAIIPSTIQPGQSVTITGSAPNAPNRTVYVAIVDPDTYSVITSGSGKTDSSGNFSVNVNIPSTVQQKKYKAYVIVMP